MNRGSKTLLTLLALLFSTAVMAQHELIIELNNGSTHSFVLADKPVVTFEGSKIKVVSSRLSLEKERSEVKDFHFVMVDAIDNVADNEVRVVLLGTNVKIYGLSESDKPIRVFDLNGRVAPALITTNGSQAEVILEGLPKGIYIVKIGNKHTIKVTKK